jgi:MHS family proline/betaine transporter-like MFS transporter
MYIRQHLPETPDFAQAEAKNQLFDNPVKSVLKLHFGSILTGVGITLLPAVTSYTLFSFMPTYLNQFSDIPMDQALFSNTLAMVVMLFAIPLVGYLSDLFPRGLFLYLSSISLFCFSYPLFKMLLAQKLNAQILLAVFSCCSEAVIPVILAGIFPTNLRYTGIAICLNVANGLFGGTAALVATFLISRTQNNLAPSYYLMSIAAISFLSALFLKQRQGNLSSNPDPYQIK